ncbi:SDR family oxidoreductase [Cupriavidus sp. 2SB]|uniref:SDR family oxidoreductase n=1 Tax=Cupriavidus sp. 2SB TaxID=2502199 RepID=UPI0010F57ECD
MASEGRATEASVDEWRKVMSIDLAGVFYGARAALPHLMRSKGCIVNTASVSGLGADWNLSYGARAALPHLMRSKGCIVNTASVSGLGADWNLSFYNAAKSGVVNLTRALALDYGRVGVRINSVCPSLTRTGLTADMFEDETLLDKFRERIALGRTAEPDDIAGEIVFMASDDARFVTGVNLPVDGGLSASNGQPPQ